LVASWQDVAASGVLGGASSGEPGTRVASQELRPREDEAAWASLSI
jgi:hypothetical protein